MRLGSIQSASSHSQKFSIYMWRSTGVSNLNSPMEKQVMLAELEHYQNTIIIVMGLQFSLYLDAFF